jgi:hypothetical protein
VAAGNASPAVLPASRHSSGRLSASRKIGLPTLRGQIIFAIAITAIKLIQVTTH